MESTIDFFQNENKNYYKNKNIIITGATGGIGTVLVETLSSLGANLLLISHDEEKIKKKFHNLLNEEESINNDNSSEHIHINSNSLNKIQYEIIDLENPKEINSKFPICLKKMKARIDNLFICHGIYSSCSIKDCSKENFDKIMNINVRSTFHILSICVPFLKLTKGNCVIISSLESFIPVKNGFLNTTSKAMINSLVQNSALELSSFGIRINAVAPGITNTDHRNDSNENNDNNISSIMEIWNNNGMTRSKGEAFPSSFITGEIIQNDNGYGLNHDLSFTHDQ